MKTVVSIWGYECWFKAIVIITNSPMSITYCWYNSIQFSSVAQSCLNLCNPVNHTTPGLPVHHQLPEFTQTHVHRITDDIQPSHPLSSPSSPAPNPSQHQSLFQWVNSSHEVAKVSEFQPHYQSFQWKPRTDLLWDRLVGSPCSPRDSQESSPTPQFKSINSSDRQSAWWTMDGGSWHSTGVRDQDHPPGNEMWKSKMAVWGGLTISCVKNSVEIP